MEVDGQSVDVLQRCADEIRDSLRGSDAERVDDGDLLRTGFNRRLVDLIAAVQLRVSQELVVGRCVHVALCQGNAGMNPRFSLR
jgi:hypothetical protein